MLQNKPANSRPSVEVKRPSGTKGNVNTMGVSSAVHTRSTVSARVAHPKPGKSC